MKVFFETLATILMGSNILYAIYLYIGLRKKKYATFTRELKGIAYVYILLLVGFEAGYIVITKNSMRGIVEIFTAQIIFWGALFVTLSLYVLQKLHSTVSQQLIYNISDLKMSLDTYIESMPGGVYRCVLDKESRVVYVSKGFTDITGYTLEDMNRRYHGNYIEIVYEDDREAFIKGSNYLMTAESTITVSYRIIDKRGKIRWLFDSANIIEDAKGVKNILSVILDITDEMSNAETDSLTKVLNKGAFNSRVKEYMTLNPHKNIGVFMIDLNYFKEVNDRFGHQTGDMILMEAANYLKEVFSGENSIVGRIGGDEFMALVKEVESEQSLIEIKKELNKNFRLYISDPQDFPVVTASVGYTYANCSENYEDVFRRADFAMYDEKKLIHAKRK